MKPALSQVCSLDAPLERDVADYAAGKCQAVELWTGKLDAYLENHGEDELRRLLDEHEVTAPVASFQKKKRVRTIFLTPSVEADSFATCLALCARSMTA